MITKCLSWRSQLKGIYENSRLMLIWQSRCRIPILFNRTALVYNNQSFSPSVSLSYFSHSLSLSHFIYDSYESIFQFLAMNFLITVLTRNNSKCPLLTIFWYIVKEKKYIYKWNSYYWKYQDVTMFCIMTIDWFS